MSQWGGNSNNEKKPVWRWLTRGDGNKSANVFATTKGWMMRWPWGDEVLVGIGGLSKNLANATMAAIEFLSPSYIANSTNQTIKLRVLFNEAVTVTGTPTVDLTSNGATANVRLTYASSESDLTAGKLVFTNTTLDKSSAAIGEAFTANANSVLTGWDGIKDAGNANAVTNAIGTFTKTVVVKQAVPVHTATLRVGTATNTANQMIGFVVKFNQAVTLTGVPTIVAIGDANAAMNLVLSYVSTGSNVAAGNLVFKSAATDFSAKTMNVVFTINATSTLTGWAGIRNDINGTPANALLVANTFTVTTV